MPENDNDKDKKKHEEKEELIPASNVASLYSGVAAKLLLEHYQPFSISSNLVSLFSSDARERKKSLEEEKHLLVKSLLEADIDPVVFDVLLSNEINRRLKVQFGVAFLILTVLFTAVSYAIVILDGIYFWGISEVAITALIIETPIQFVGLLYIIARNLFPDASNDNNSSTGLTKISKN